MLTLRDAKTKFCSGPYLLVTYYKRITIIKLNKLFLAPHDTSVISEIVLSEQSDPVSLLYMR